MHRLGFPHPDSFKLKRYRHGMFSVHSPPLGGFSLRLSAPPGRQPVLVGHCIALLPSALGFPSHALLDVEIFYKHRCGFPVPGRVLFSLQTILFPLLLPVLCLALHLPLPLFLSFITAPLPLDPCLLLLPRIPRGWRLYRRTWLRSFRGISLLEMRSWRPEILSNWLKCCSLDSGFRSLSELLLLFLKLLLSLLKLLIDLSAGLIHDEVQLRQVLLRILSMKPHHFGHLLRRQFLECNAALVPFLDFLLKLRQ
mmetsp:Transcript_101840/g.233185  ORF Transcript_101840/g.233185 Transcript_101840/m.233185 type:complete len:253 (-) Transcript_101840:313-1071(-)